MRKRNMLMMLTLSGAVWIGGCSANHSINSKKMTTSTTAASSQESGMSSGAQEAIQILKDHHAFNHLRSVRLTRIDDRYILADVGDLNLYVVTGILYIVDLKEHQLHLMPHLSGPVRYIQYMQVKGHQITFNFTGRNAVGPNRTFPFREIYNIDTNSVEQEPIYYDLTDDPGYVLGNAVNELTMDAITAQGKTITFHVATDKNTILAGGISSPKIQTGYDAKQKAFFLDYENVLPTEQMKQDLQTLQKEPWINSASYKTYTGPAGNTHLVLYVRFKGVAEYTCEFVTDQTGKNPTLSLKLLLK